MPKMMQLAQFDPACGRNKRGKVPVATEDELLEFCNSVRQAGGAEVLEALLPSTPGVPSECLIARGLNFDCTVGNTVYGMAWNGTGLRDGFFIPGTDSCFWVMTVHYGNSEDSMAKAQEVANALGLTQFANEIALPEHIGNAAEAFDQRVAFTEYLS